MSISLDAATYAVVYSVLLLLYTPSLPSSLCLRLLCLRLTGRSHDFLTGGPRRRRQEHWPQWCGVYNDVDYTTFILLKTQFCAGYRHMRGYMHMQDVHENTILQLLTYYYYYAALQYDINAACCYRRSIVVFLSVCRSLCHIRETCKNS